MSRSYFLVFFSLAFFSHASAHCWATGRDDTTPSAGASTPFISTLEIPRISSNASPSKRLSLSLFRSLIGPYSPGSSCLSTSDIAALALPVRLYYLSRKYRPPFCYELLSAKQRENPLVKIYDFATNTLGEQFSKSVLQTCVIQNKKRKQRRVERAKMFIVTESWFFLQAQFHYRAFRFARVFG